MVQANVVLAAITDLLKERGIDSATTVVNPTHYFGTLMVLLEQRDQHPPETIGAILYLLSVLMPQLPRAVVKSKSEMVAEVLISVLDKHAADAHVAKHVLECSAVVVGALVDLPAAAWAQASSSTHRNASKLLQVLLVYSLDHRPRIRRAGQEGVRDTIKAMYEHSVSTCGAQGAGVAPRIGLPKAVNDTVTQFCIREISQCTPKDCQVVLFLCGLLQSCIQYLSVAASGRIMEALLSMVGKGNSILVVQAMRTVDAFFIHACEIHLSPASATGDEKSREKFLHMASQLLNVLLTLKPHQNDQLASAAYLHTLKNGVVHFTGALETAGEVGAAGETLRASYAKVPELLELIGAGLLSPKVEVVKASSKAMSEILRKAVTKRMIESSIREAEHRASMGSSATGTVAPPFYRVVEWLENLLGYRHKTEWNRILVLAADLFRAAAPSTAAQALLVPLLRQLDVMHNEAANEVASEDPSRDYRPALDEALGAAIETFGPEQVLSVLPLNLPTDFNGKNKSSLHEQLNASRSWLLPLFRAHVGPHASLAFFLDFFVPIASELHGLEKKAVAQGKLLDSKVFTSLKIAVWDIFPSLASALPKDTPHTFKSMAKTLVAGYLNVDEMGFTHAPICKAIGAVIRRMKDVGQLEQVKKVGAADDDEDAPASSKGDDEDDVFDDDEEDEDDIDSDDEDALAKAKAERLAKKSTAKAASKSEEATTASAATTAATSSRRPSHFTPAEARDVLTHTLAPLAKHLLPVLYNLAAMPHEKKDAVFEAIAQYASIAEPELLNQTFKTVLRKLLEHTMAIAARKQAAEADQQKPLAEGETMDETATPTKHAISHQELQRAHLLTDIVYALCAHSAPQLSAENLSYLYKIVQNQLGSEAEDGMDASLQKKLYKILAVLIALPGFFDERWRELVPELQEAAVTLQPAALKPRLACIRLVLLHLPSLMLKDKAALAVLPSFLGEVILASKETSARTRDLAFEVLVDLGRKMVQVQDEKRDANAGASSKDLFGSLQNANSDQPMLAEYIYMLAGGLAGSSAHMQSASVLCLARLLYEFKSILGGGAIVQNLLATVLPFFESKSRELIKSLLAFVKVCILTFPLGTLEAQAPAIVGGLVLWCAEKKQRFKLKIKIMFEILMKKLGVEAVRALVPEQHTALVEHIRKTKEREKRQKTEAWQARKGAKGADAEDDGVSHRQLQDYDSIMRSEADVDMDDGSVPAAGKKSRSSKDANAMWIRESDVDFMDPSVVSKVSSSNPAADVVRGPAQFGHGVSQDAATGKMRIADSAASSSMIDIEALDGDIKTKQREKRKRAADAEEEEESSAGVKRQQLPGAQFRSTKARGDMKRRGQMDPYAFLPLDPMAMNKRKKFTAQRRLESIVTAAKVGSQTGSAIAKGHARSHKNKSHKKHGHK